MNPALATPPAVEYWRRLQARRRVYLKRALRRAGQMVPPDTPTEELSRQYRMLRTETHGQTIEGE